MRIAVVGPRKNEVILKVESAFNSKVKSPSESTIINYAAETYKYFDEINVVFGGSPFDFLALDPVEGVDDVYEQICVNSLVNLDYIAVIAMDMDKHQLDIYKEYAKLYPNKIYIYSTPAEFELRLR